MKIIHGALRMQCCAEDRKLIAINILRWRTFDPGPVPSATITLSNLFRPPVRGEISPVFKGVCRMGANL
jgi:hypothetical protein